MANKPSLASWCFHNPLSVRVRRANTMRPLCLENPRKPRAAHDDKGSVIAVGDIVRENSVWSCELNSQDSPETVLSNGQSTVGWGTKMDLFRPAVPELSETLQLQEIKSNSKVATQWVKFAFRWSESHYFFFLWGFGSSRRSGPHNSPGPKWTRNGPFSPSWSRESNKVRVGIWLF